MEAALHLGVVALVPEVQRPEDGRPEKAGSPQDGHILNPKPSSGSPLDQSASFTADR